MQQLHASQVTSISDLKRNPSGIIRQANGQPVAVLNHNVAAAYLVPAATYEKMMDLVDDQALSMIVQHRLNDGSTPVEVDPDEL